MPCLQIQYMLQSTPLQAAGRHSKGSPTHGNVNVWSVWYSVCVCAYSSSTGAGVCRHPGMECADDHMQGFCVHDVCIK